MSEKHARSHPNQQQEKDSGFYLVTSVEKEDYSDPRTAKIPSTLPIELCYNGGERESGLQADNSLLKEGPVSGRSKVCSHMIKASRKGAIAPFPGPGAILQLTAWEREDNSEALFVLTTNAKR